jgi:hypothetical protein
VLYCCLVSVVSLASVSFLGATLEAAFTQQHGLGSTGVGACFALASFSQLLLCPVAGWLSDRWPPRTPILTGLCLTSIALLFLGPSPLVQSSPFPVQLVSLALLGCGVSLSVIPTFVDQLKAAAHLGESSQPVIAGLSASVFSLGEVLGPLVGSWLVEVWNFELACTVWGLLCIAVLAVGLLTEAAGGLRRCIIGGAYETIDEAAVEKEDGNSRKEGSRDGRQQAGRARRVKKGPKTNQRRSERGKGTGEAEEKEEAVRLSDAGGDEVTTSVVNLEPEEGDDGGHERAASPAFVFVQRSAHNEDT